MSTITTELATPARWDDVQRSLTGGGDGASCQCIWPMLRSKDWNATTTPQRRDLLENEIEHGPPPGIIAYVDGEPAAWVRVGPRLQQQRILHTRGIVKATTEPPDAADVWVITCFVVRREHRGIGLTAALLNAAVEYAAASGARVLEAYPVDTSEGSHRANDLFHGTASTFVAAGFTQSSPVSTRRVLVTRDLVH